MTDLAIKAWADFSKTSNKINPPTSPDFASMPESGLSDLPIGSRIRTYITGKVDKPIMAAIKLPRPLRIIVDAASHVIGIRPIHIVQQMSLMERTLYWAQKPWRSKRFPEPALWTRYREEWEFQRQNLREVVEQTEWHDEDDDSDLRSWHASDSGSDS